MGALLRRTGVLLRLVGVTLQWICPLIYKYLIFFASGVQTLRKLTYINLMVLEVLENELLDLLSLQAQLVGRRIQTIAITSRIEGNKKNISLVADEA